MNSAYISTKTFISETFLKHPRSVCMSYYSHCSFALYMARLHGYGTYVSIVHAFLPWMYSTTVTELNELIKQKLEENGCRDTIDETKSE